MQHPRKREFLALYERTGWTQAELARKLELTAGGVSGVVKGETIPSAGLVKLLNLVMLHEQPKALPPGTRRGVPAGGRGVDRALDRLLVVLAQVRTSERAILLNEFTKVARLHTPRVLGPSSGVDAAALREFRAAASGNLGVDALAGLAPARSASKAGSTSGGASGKRRAAPRGRAGRGSVRVHGPK